MASTVGGLLGFGLRFIFDVRIAAVALSVAVRIHVSERNSFFKNRFITQNTNADSCAADTHIPIRPFPGFNIMLTLWK